MGSANWLCPYLEYAKEDHQYSNCWSVRIVTKWVRFKISIDLSVIRCSFLFYFVLMIFCNISRDFSVRHLGMNQKNSPSESLTMFNPVYDNHLWFKLILKSNLANFSFTHLVAQSSWNVTQNTAVICRCSFQSFKGLETELDGINERDFARFELKMGFRDVVLQLQKCSSFRE